MIEHNGNQLHSLLDAICSIRWSVKFRVEFYKNKPPEKRNHRFFSACLVPVVCQFYGKITVSTDSIPYYGIEKRVAETLSTAIDSLWSRLQNDVLG
jgi:hypothetical protein